MLKNIKLMAAFLVIACLPSFALVSYDLKDFEKPGTNVGLSFLTMDGESFVKTNLSPDLKLGPVGVGFDVNLYLSTSGADVPNELQSVVLRKLSYDHNNWIGVEWGRLQHVSYGYGLIMDDYDSGSFGTQEFSNEKAGTKGYIKLGNFQVDAMTTATKVNAGRLSYTIPSSPLLGSPIVFGVNYVNDSDGINETFGDIVITRNETTAMSADIGLPIAGDFLTLFMEYGQLESDDLSDKVIGTSYGFLGSLFNFFNYRLESRTVEAGFVPGYFSSSYEATGHQFNSNGSTDDINGVVGVAGFSLLKDYVKFDLKYEDYDFTGAEPLLSGAFGWSKIWNTVGVINYTQTFTGDTKPVLVANILKYTGGNFDYIFNIKRVYSDFNSYEETVSIGVRANFDKIFNPFN